MSFVQVKNVHKSYDEQRVLSNLNFNIQKGELITLLGSSGCGKSTLLRIIAGLTLQDQGSIVIDDVDVSNLSPKARELGMVFQDYSLFPNMSVFNNIAFGLKLKKLPKEEIKQKVYDMLDLVSLRQKADEYPHELSGGQQQRVALARSLVTEPKVLLLDEPLSALDQQIRKKLQEELRNIQKKLNITTVVVTHDQDEAMAISDRIFIMNEGKIVHQGTAQKIYHHPKNEFTARFIGNYNVFSYDEISTLFPERKYNSMNKYAIRPEIISMHAEHQTLSFKGKIKEIRVLTNVIQLQVSVGEQKMYVEHLNSDPISYTIDEECTFYINEADILPLEAD